MSKTRLVDIYRPITSKASGLTCEVGGLLAGPTEQLLGIEGWTARVHYSQVPRLGPRIAYMMRLHEVVDMLWCTDPYFTTERLSVASRLASE